MQRLWVGLGVVGGALLGAWLAYLSTPIPVRSLVPNVEFLDTWHATVIGSLVVNRETQ